jgi:hypothetical protein
MVFVQMSTFSIFRYSIVIDVINRKQKFVLQS